LPMGMTAENLAAKHSISRAEQDEWALESQTRAEAARDAGRLAEEIMSFEIKSRKGAITFSQDEFIRGASAAEGLPALRPAFKSDGTVTAGNASGINDGASAMVVTSEAYAQRKNLKPLARIRSWSARGCDPSIMGIGPVFAIPAALER